MVKYTIEKNNDKYEPYYKIKLGFSMVDDSDFFDTSSIKIYEDDFNNNQNKVNDLIKFLYICYYSDDATRGNISGYSHVNNRCYYDDEMDCDCDKEHDKAYFTYSHPSSPDRYWDWCYRFNSISMKYIDENNISHPVKIEFDEKDIEDIKNGIIESHVIKFGNLNSKFNYQDPDIFLKTSQLCYKNNNKL